MMIPNNTGMLSSRGAQDVYSQFAYSRPKMVRCAIVHMKEIVAKTSVRVDQSASRGNTEEDTLIGLILFPKDVVIRVDDKFAIAGKVLRVMTIEQRFSVAGQLDHFEVSFGVWE